MSSAVQAIAIAAPTVMAQTIFSMRRFDKGVDNFAENPIYGGLNFDIAAGQVVKGTRAATDIKPIEEALSGATKAIKNTSIAADIAKDVSTVTKVINGMGKGIKTVVDFTAATINPIICITGLSKVIFGDKEDKLDAGLEEAASIGTMFGFENTYKAITGMPKVSYVNGKQVSESVEGLYKKVPAVAKGVENFVEWCNKTKLFNKIPMNSLPGILKGILFVTASITGYKVGGTLYRGIRTLVCGKTNSSDAKSDDMVMAMA